MNRVTLKVETTQQGNVEVTISHPSDSINVTRDLLDSAYRAVDVVVLPRP